VISSQAVPTLFKHRWTSTGWLLGLIVLLQVTLTFDRFKQWWHTLLRSSWEQAGVWLGELEWINQTEEDAEASVERLANLTVYQVKPIPALLAVVRFTDLDIEPPSVIEDHYRDDAGELERPQEEILEALYAGMDVAVATHLEPEEMPTIQEILAD